MIFSSLIFFFFLFNTPAFSDDTYGVILSGGYNLENNSYRYYNSTKQMYSAFRSSGIKRDHITTLYADGGVGINTTKAVSNPWTLFFTNKARTLAPSASLEGDNKSDMKYPATPTGIAATFDDLATKVKPGDNLVFFITDHGNQNYGINLWNGYDYSMSDLLAQLQKIPKGVNIQIITNICFGGQLLRLTSSNICIVANSDDKHLTYSNQNDDPFITNLTNAIKSPGTKTNNRPSLLSVFEAGKNGDISENKIHLTSMDYFIANQHIVSETFDHNTNLNKVSCNQEQSPIASLQDEITTLGNFLSKVSDSRKINYEKYLKKKLDDISDELNSYQNKYSNWRRGEHQKKLDILKKEWSSLAEDEKQQLRPKYTTLVEKLNSEDNDQRKKLDHLEADQKRAIAEMRFLKYATPAQLEQYYNIRRCLEHEI